MASFEDIWVDQAKAQLNSLPPQVRQAVLATVELLKNDPERGTYNKRADSYTAEFDYGFIMYAVVQRRLKIIMLRISAPGY